WHQIPHDDIYEETVERRGILKIPDRVSDLLPQHEQYLNRRGFDPDVIRRLWGVKGIGLAQKLQWRLFIPIHDIRGRVVSWTTRSIGNHSLRYISASDDEEEIPHKTILYGAQHAQHVIFINEGPLDAWAIGPGAIATCGTGYSTEQMARMTKYPVRVVCFDSQPDAQRRADQLCRELSMYPGHTENVLLESGEDPASAHPDEIKELREKFLVS